MSSWACCYWVQVPLHGHFKQRRGLAYTLNVLKWANLSADAWLPRLVQELQMAGINFKAFDLGGHEIARRVWKDYYAQVWAAGWADQQRKHCCQWL